MRSPATVSARHGDPLAHGTSRSAASQKPTTGLRRVHLLPYCCRVSSTRTHSFNSVRTYIYRHRGIRPNPPTAAHERVTCSFAPAHCNPAAPADNAALAAAPLASVTNARPRFGTARTLITSPKPCSAARIAESSGAPAPPLSPSAHRTTTRPSPSPCDGRSHTCTARRGASAHARSRAAQRRARASPTRSGAPSAALRLLGPGDAPLDAPSSSLPPRFRPPPPAVMRAMPPPRAPH